MSGLVDSLAVLTTAIAVFFAGQAQFAQSIEDDQIRISKQLFAIAVINGCVIFGGILMGFSIALKVVG